MVTKRLNIYFSNRYCNTNINTETRMDDELLSMYINGDYPFIESEDYFNGSIIDTLLTKYVDIHLKTHNAKYNIDYIENSKYYNEKSKIITYTIGIFEKRKYRLFKKYIERGVSLNTRNGQFFNHTYLGRAIYLGEYDIALWLIKKGANITFSCGYNAILFLSKIQCKTILSYIGDINMKNYYGSTLLHMAVIDGDNHAIRYLLKRRKANPFITNIYNVSPFSIVINYTNDIVYNLIKYSIGLSRKISNNDNDHDIWLIPMAACNSIFNRYHMDDDLRLPLSEVGSHETDEYILSCDIMTRIVYYTKSDITKLFTDYIKKMDHIFYTLPQPIAEEISLFINMID